MCAFYLSDVSRGREPNHRLAFGKRLRFLALCSVFILAVTLCRFAIYLKTALCRAAPLTSRPLTSILYRERVRSMGQRTQPQVGVRRLLANACVMQRVYLSSHFVSFRNISQNCPMPSSPVDVTFCPSMSIRYCERVLSRGREPGDCLQTLALYSVFILADTLCRLVVNLRNRGPAGSPI